MRIQRVNRDDPEKHYINVTNKEGATITAGYPVALAAGTSMDGNKAVIANAAADFKTFIGVADEDIPNNEVGRVQVAGLVNSCLMSNEGSSVTITAGDWLIPVAAGFSSGAAPAAAVSANKVLYNKNTVTLSAATYVSALLLGL